MKVYYRSFNKEEYKFSDNINNFRGRLSALSRNYRIMLIDNNDYFLEVFHGLITIYSNNLQKIKNIPQEIYDIITLHLIT